MLVIGSVSQQGLHLLTQTSKKPSPSSLHATSQDLHKRPPPPGPCGPQRAENETGPAAPAAVSSHNQSRTSQTQWGLLGLATFSSAKRPAPINDLTESPSYLPSFVPLPFLDLEPRCSKTKINSNFYCIDTAWQISPGNATWLARPLLQRKR